MNTIDKTKIISASTCENSIAFRYALLLAEITLLDAIPLQWRQSQSLFSSHDHLTRIKRRHNPPFTISASIRNVPRELNESPYVAPRRSPSHIIPQRTQRNDAYSKQARKIPFLRLQDYLSKHAGKMTSCSKEFYIKPNLW